MLLKGIYMGSRKVTTKRGSQMEIYDVYDDGLVRVMLPADSLQSAGIQVGDFLSLEVRTSSLVFGEVDTLKKITKDGKV